MIARISPNVSVHAMEPDLDALGIYLHSLRALREAVPGDVLLLPGHGLPFYGLHTRIGELIKAQLTLKGQFKASGVTPAKAENGTGTAGDRQWRSTQGFSGTLKLLLHEAPAAAPAVP